ncbi:hypothetical protein HOH45_02190 [bacterium]|nr:hypothetical protein [bacterium]
MNISSNREPNIDGNHLSPQKKNEPPQVTAPIESAATQPQITTITQLLSKLGSELTLSVLDAEAPNATSGFKTYLADNMDSLTNTAGTLAKQELTSLSSVSLDTFPRGVLSAGGESVKTIIASVAKTIDATESTKKDIAKLKIKERLLAPQTSFDKVKNKFRTFVINTINAISCFTLGRQIIKSLTTSFTKTTTGSLMSSLEKKFQSEEELLLKLDYQNKKNPPAELSKTELQDIKKKSFTLAKEKAKPIQKKWKEKLTALNITGNQLTDKLGVGNTLTSKIRFNEKNLTTIKNMETNKDPDLIALQNTLLAKFNTRNMVKTHLKNLLKQPGTLDLTKTLFHSFDISSPSSLREGINNIFESFKDNKHGFKDKLKKILSSDSTHPITAVLRDQLGEGIDVLTLLLDDTILDFIQPILFGGSDDDFLSFIDNPAKFILNHISAMPPTSTDAVSMMKTVFDEPSTLKILTKVMASSMQKKMPFPELSAEASLEKHVQFLESALPIAKKLAIQTLDGKNVFDVQPAESSDLQLPEQFIHLLASHIHENITVPNSGDISASDSLMELASGLNDTLGMVTNATTFFDAPVAQAPSPTPLLEEPISEIDPYESDRNAYDSYLADSDVSEQTEPESYGSFFWGMASSGVNMVSQGLTDSVNLANDGYTDLSERGLESVADLAGTGLHAALDLGMSGLDATVSAATFGGTAIYNTTASGLSAGLEVSKTAAAYTATTGLSSIIDKKLQSLGNVDQNQKPVKEKVYLELDSKKVESFSKQALSLLSGYISENPGMIRSIGSEALSYMKESNAILQDNDLDTSEKSTQLMELAKTHLTSIGDSISKDTSPLSKEVGKALKNTGALLGSRIVTQSLGQSSLFTGETKTNLIDMSVKAIKTKTQKTLTNITAPIQGPKEKKRPNYTKSIA